MKDKFSFKIIYLAIFILLATSVNVYALDYCYNSYNTSSQDYSSYKIVNNEDELIKYIVSQDRERKNQFKVLYLVEPNDANVEKIEKLINDMNYSFMADDYSKLALFTLSTSEITFYKVNYEGKNVIEIVFNPHGEYYYSYINDMDYPVVNSIDEYKDFLINGALSFKDNLNAIINIPLTTENLFEVNKIIGDFSAGNELNDAYIKHIITGKSWSVVATMVNGEYVLYVKYSFNYSEMYLNQDEDNKRIKEILSQIITDDMYAHEKVKAIHDYIVKNFRYDTSYKNYYIKEMLDEGKGVCQAYSLLTYRMLSLANVPVKFIVGKADTGSKIEGHSWNMVNLGGYWFNLDVTWDDPIPDVKGRIKYKYYMLTDDVFRKNHMPSKLYTYPSANKNYYEYLNEFAQNESNLIKNKTNDGVNIKIRDSYVDFTSTGQVPVVLKGRTLVPIRAVFEQLGYDVSYDIETSTATITDGETIVSIISNNDIALVNGVEKKMDVCATVLNGRILVPVRFISEAFNNIVIWDGENSTVIIH